MNMWSDYYAVLHYRSNISHVQQKRVAAVFFLPYMFIIGEF